MAMQTITEKDYPISNRWLIKNCKTIWSIPFFIAGFIVAVVDPKLFADPSVQTQGQLPTPLTVTFFFSWIIFLISGEYLWNVLRRKYFHYTIVSDNLEIKSGIIAKQERHMPYNKLQNIFVKQDLLDRLFGLKQVVIENASGSGTVGKTEKVFGMKIKTQPGYLTNNNGQDSIGNIGNSLNIPGLLSTDAEALKEILLGKMIKHSKDDVNSGL